MRRVRSILMDIANHPRLRVDGVYMEKVEISNLGLGVQYGILAHNMDRDICTLYIPDKSTIIVLDDVDPELKGEHLHVSKYGRCPCTFKRVLEEIVRFSPELAVKELDEIKYSVRYGDREIKEKIYTIKLPCMYDKDEITVTNINRLHVHTSD